MRLLFIDIVYSSNRDFERAPESRVCPTQAMNFIFLGNPGSGKTTVARIFAEMLAELKIRGEEFVDVTGQDLLQEGSSKFPALLKKVTPGVLFIDEVYQLNPAGQGDGQAITNMLMKATEDDRDKLSVIVAGMWQSLLLI